MTPDAIDITGLDLVAFIQTVYDLSRPVGLGVLHYIEGDTLTEAEARSLVEPTGRIAVSMDYVRGRGCKMTVFREPDGRLWIRGSWFDHTPDQLTALLRRSEIARGGAA